jgi:hypothetical protein
MARSDPCSLVFSFWLSPSSQPPARPQQPSRSALPRKSGLSASATTYPRTRMRGIGLGFRLPQGHEQDSEEGLPRCSSSHCPTKGAADEQTSQLSRRTAKNYIDPQYWRSATTYCRSVTPPGHNRLQLDSMNQRISLQSWILYC